MNCFDVYSLYPVEPVKGLGSMVYDADGNEYLDLYGGHAVISIGHAHPHYVTAITRQLSRLGFYSNSVLNSLQGQLASKLGEMSGYDDYSLFLCNSGAEANENAVKLASFATGRDKVLAFDKAFHGRTSGAVALTDNPKIVSPFNQTDKVTFVPLNDIENVERELSSMQYAAVIIEGIQGVAGIHVPDDRFMVNLREVTRKYGTKLIIDEVQSGYGRSGRFFAHQHAGIRPDIISMAKGMGNGFPIGGILIAPDIQPVKGMLGTTFGGNHLACAAAIAVLDVMDDEQLVANAARVGEWAIARLKETGGPIKEVRGRGLMIGIEIDGDAQALRHKLLFENHIFTGGAGATTIRLLPALNITQQHIQQFINALNALQ